MPLFGEITPCFSKFSQQGRSPQVEQLHLIVLNFLPSESPSIVKIGQGGLNLLKALSVFLVCSGDIGINMQSSSGKMQRQETGPRCFPPFCCIWTLETSELNLLIVIQRAEKD